MRRKYDVLGSYFFIIFIPKGTSFIQDASLNPSTIKIRRSICGDTQEKRKEQEGLWTEVGYFTLVTSVPRETIVTTFCTPINHIDFTACVMFDGNRFTNNVFVVVIKYLFSIKTWGDHYNTCTAVQP